MFTIQILLFVQINKINLIQNQISWLLIKKKYYTLDMFNSPKNEYTKDIV